MKARTKRRIVKWTGGTLTTLATLVALKGGCEGFCLGTTFKGLGLNPYTGKDSVNKYFNARDTLYGLRDLKASLPFGEEQANQRIPYTPSTQPALREKTVSALQDSAELVREYALAVQGDIKDLRKNDNDVKSYSAWNTKKMWTSLLEFFGVGALAIFLGKKTADLNQKYEDRELEERLERERIKERLNSS